MVKGTTSMNPNKRINVLQRQLPISSILNNNSVSPTSNINVAWGSTVNKLDLYRRKRSAIKKNKVKDKLKNIIKASIYNNHPIIIKKKNMSKPQYCTESSLSLKTRDRLHDKNRFKSCHVNMKICRYWIEINPVYHTVCVKVKDKLGGVYSTVIKGFNDVLLLCKQMEQRKNVQLLKATDHGGETSYIIFIGNKRHACYKIDMIK